jgi:hypothetical protein
MIYFIIILVLFFLIKTLFELNNFNLLTLIYLSLIFYLIIDIINKFECFDNINFDNNKYNNSIYYIDKDIINEKNNDFKINLDKIKNKLNIDKNKIIFNLSNRPLIKEIKNYEQIKSIIKPIFDEIKLFNFNIYLKNVINIEQSKVDNQAKLTFIMIIDNNNDLNKKIFVEVLFEKIFEDQEIFNYNIKSNFKNYINQLIIII